MANVASILHWWASSGDKREALCMADDDDDDVGRWLCYYTNNDPILPIIKYQKYRSAISRAVVPINNKSLKPSDSIERCDEIRWMWWWWRSEKNAWLLCIDNEQTRFIFTPTFLLISIIFIRLFLFYTSAYARFFLGEFSSPHIFTPRTRNPLDQIMVSK